MHELSPPPAGSRRSRRLEEQAREAGTPSRRNLLLAGGAAVAAASTATVLGLRPSPNAAAAGGADEIQLTAALMKANAAEAAEITAANAARSGALKTVAKAAKKRPRAGGATSPAAGGSFSMDRDLSPAHLLSRATYGRTPASAAEMKRLGPREWLERQLAPAEIADPEVRIFAQIWPHLSRTLEEVVAAGGGVDYLMPMFCDHIGRAIWSERQLFEVMVDFWSNHLNVFATDGPGNTFETRHLYQRDVIREHTLGDFESMLLASAFHPTMLAFLNGANSTGAEPNENYSRELLELHTVGVDAGYTERDVKQGALLLTGWTLKNWGATYVPANHYVGELEVFGFTTANASAEMGEAAQRAYLKYLARHPSTAAHLAHKLAVRFVSDTPPASLVKKLAATYSEHGTAIVPVLRALFSSEEFAQSERMKLRRPMEALVATARALDLKPGPDHTGLYDLVFECRHTGHGPLYWTLPNGYPDTADAWQSPASALVVFNVTSGWLRGGGPRVQNPGFAGFLKDPPQDRDAVITAVFETMLGREPSAAERQGAVTLLESGRNGGNPLPTTFSAGSYDQRETVFLTAMLLLSSPAHLTR